MGFSKFELTMGIQVQEWMPQAWSGDVLFSSHRWLSLNYSSLKQKQIAVRIHQIFLSESFKFRNNLYFLNADL